MVPVSRCRYALFIVSAKTAKAFGLVTDPLLVFGIAGAASRGKMIMRSSRSCAYDDWEALIRCTRSRMSFLVVAAEAGRTRTPRAGREAPKTMASDMKGQARRAVSIGLAETFLPVT